MPAILGGMFAFGIIINIFIFILLLIVLFLILCLCLYILDKLCKVLNALFQTNIFNSAGVVLVGAIFCIGAFLYTVPPYLYHLYDDYQSNENKYAQARKDAHAACNRYNVNGGVVNSILKPSPAELYKKSGMCDKDAERIGR